MHPKTNYSGDSYLTTLPFISYNKKQQQNGWFTDVLM